MAIDENLSAFLKDGLERGIGRDEIRQVLLDTGWPSDQVESALDGFADVAFPIPVPRPKPYLSAREAFIYLVLFSALYVSAFSLGSLLFALIDRVWPDPSVDPAMAERTTRGVIRWSISWLVVTFPVFAVVSWRNDRAVRAEPRLRLSKMRRWLTYLTLFVAGGILVGDVTTLVYTVLSGGLTMPFVAKVLTVAAVAGSVFAYLVHELRQDEAVS